MKQFYLFILLFGVLSAPAQTKLTFEQHAFEAGQHNPMTFCEFKNAGAEGNNMTWDFKDLKKINEFTGHLNVANNSDFFLTNTELEEFGVRFYYDVNEEGIDHYGFLSKSERTSVIYDKPFKKIQFPFSIGDNFTSNFSGGYFSGADKIGDIDGVGYVHADAWGTIELPGNSIYRNTLRVKATKTYTIEFENSTQNIEMTTYRWYNSAHRYPLLVLIETTTSTDKGGSSQSTMAAYNSNAVKFLPTNTQDILANLRLSLYPNPVSTEFTVELTSDKNKNINLSITDISGRTLVSSVKKDVLVGVNKIDLSSEVNSLKEGVYILNLDYDGKLVTREFSIVR